jgi:hypothetical protein
MKRNNKKTKNKSVVQDLAEQFSNEFNEKLPVVVLPNGDILYKDFLIRKTLTQNWALVDAISKDVRGEFYLKTCALMAAKSLMQINLTRYNEVKRLDLQYWSSHSDLQIYKKNIKSAQDFERYLILLNKLEETDIKNQHFRDTISRMFKWSFV